MKGLNIVDQVIAEPLGGAHRDYHATAINIGDVLAKQLADLQKLSIDELLEKRYKRLMSYGIH